MSLDNVVTSENLLYCFERACNLLFSVSGHQGVAYERIVRGDGGGYYGIYENAFVKQVARHVECLVVIAYEEGNYGG